MLSPKAFVIIAGQKSIGVGVVNFLARSMFWHPMFQVFDIVDGLPMELEFSKFNST